MQKQHVRALSRDLQKARALLGENLEVVEGDTLRLDTVHAAVQGVHTVICATGARPAEERRNPEQVDFEGVSNLVVAAASAGVRRFLLVSSIGVTQPEHPVSQFGHVLAAKRRGEDAVRRSGMAYTIVRPGGITDGPGGQGLTIGQGDLISGTISRADLAEVLIRALQTDATRYATFEVVESEGAPPQDWDALFSGLRNDQQANASAG
jgi:uncharacterized protein YbjT (DUF2867 family)